MIEQARAAQPGRGASGVVALVLFAMWLPSSCLQAQLRTGIDAGGSWSAVATSTNVYASGADCGTFGRGSGSGLEAGASLTIPDLFSDALGLTLRAVWSTASPSLETTPSEPQRMLDPATLSLVDVDRKFRLDADLQSVAIDIMARVPLGAASIEIGPTIGYRLSASATTTDVLAGPSWARFRDGSRERPLTGSAAHSRASLAAGVRAAVGYDFRIAEHAGISPYLSVAFVPTAAFKDESWTATSVAAGVRVWLEHVPSPAPVVEEPRPVVPQPKRVPPEITTSLRIHSVDSSGAQGDTLFVHTETVIERRFVPLVPAVFFGRGDSIPPPRYQTLTTAEAASFQVSSMHALGDLVAQRLVLNVIGRRLADDPSLRVTLVGMTSSDEPAALGERRVQNVREYLQNVWGIESRRIAADPAAGTMPRSNEATEEGRGENRRVEFVQTHGGRSESLLAPIITERVRNDRLPARVRIELDASPRSAVADWRIRIDGGAQITGGGDSLPVSNDLDLRARGDSVLTFAVEAVVNGREGQVSRSVASIPIRTVAEQRVIEGWTRQSAGRRVMTMQIVGFNFNSAELLERHRQMLRAIVDSIQAGETIAVTGYSDLLGDQGRNLELSRQRAEAVAAFIRDELQRAGRAPAALTTTGAGSDDSRYGNDLPEGRVLSRGVTVVAEE